MSDGIPESNRNRKTPMIRRVRSLRTGAPYFVAVCVVFVALSLTMLLDHIGLSTPNVVMCFVLAVAFVAARYGTGPSIVASVLSATALAYFFFPPIFSLAVADIQNLVMMAVMITVALMISRLTDQVRFQVENAERHAERAESLYHLSADLAESSGPALSRAAIGRTQATFGGQVSISIDDVTSLSRESEPSAGSPGTKPTEAYSIPLDVATKTIGTLRLELPVDQPALSPDQRQLLAAFAHQIATAIDRDRLTSQVRQVELQAEAERLRAGLLSSVTHDLRTPLAVISGASSSLLVASAQLPEAVQQDLLQAIYDSSNRMARLVDNLLNMTRVESGQLTLHKERHVLEETIGAALHQMKPLWGQRSVRVDLPKDLPLIPLDDVLIQQLFLNLFENIHKYTAPDAPVEISAEIVGEQCQLSIADHGPGITPGHEQQIFEKFYRGGDNHALRPGAGLGLTICHAIVTAHGGEISAQNRPEGGLVVRIDLPLQDQKLLPEKVNVMSSTGLVEVPFGK